MLDRRFIRAIARRAARHMLDTGAVSGIAFDKLEHLLDRALHEEFALEGKLRDEARKLVEAHSAEARSQGADITELLERVVRKLAEERGVVLR